MGLAVNQLGNLRGFESLPAHHVPRASALIAQLVEHILGKNEVIGSSPIQGSTLSQEAKIMPARLMAHVTALVQAITERFA